MNMPTPDSSDADQVEAVVLGRQVRHQPEGQPESDDSDRHVDEEDPLPAQPVDEKAAGQRSDQGGDACGRAPDAHRDAAPLGGEDAGDRGQCLRGEQRRADALHHAGRDEHADAFRTGHTTAMRR